MERSIYAYTYVEQPFDEVAEVLREAPATLFQPATDRAAADARALQTELHVDVGGFAVGRDITVEVGEVRSTDRHTVTLPISWRASDAAALFPSLDGVVDVQALSLSRPLTQVTLAATYRPPLGVLGAAGDALLGRQLAEAAAHSFVHDVAERIDANLRQRAPAEA